MAEKDKHVKPSGPLVDFYLAANAQYKKGERIPLSVNGFEYTCTVGSRQKLPKEVVDVLQNAKSRTERVKTSIYDPEKGGVPRKQEDFYKPEKDYVYHSEFDVEILSVKD